MPLKVLNVARTCPCDLPYRDRSCGILVCLPTFHSIAPRACTSLLFVKSGRSCCLVSGKCRCGWKEDSYFYSQLPGHPGVVLRVSISDTCIAVCKFLLRSCMNREGLLYLNIFSRAECFALKYHQRITRKKDDGFMVLQAVWNIIGLVSGGRFGSWSKIRTFSIQNRIDHNCNQTQKSCFLREHFYSVGHYYLHKLDRNM